MKRSSHITVLALLPIILTACGGTGKPSTSIEAAMTDFAFLPNAFTVPAGKEIALTATNGGATAHSLLVMKHGHQISNHFSPEDEASVYWQLPRVLPGESIQTRFRAPNEPGVYQMVCGIAGHYEAGMVARLVVVATP